MDALPPSLLDTGLSQPVPAGQAGLAILLAELSDALAKLPANSALTATIVRLLPLPVPADPGAAKPPAGTLVQVSTPDGPAQIRLPPQIQVSSGARLDIAVSQAGPQPQWRLLAIDDRPVTQAGLAPAPTPATTAAPAADQIQAAAKPPPPSGIPATLVTSSDPALPSGTTLLVRITGLTPPPEPDTDLAPPEEAPPPAVPPPATATVPTPSPAATPQAAVPSAPLPSPPPAEVSGQVLPNTDAGKPLLRTPIGLVALDAEPQTLPPGTAVTLQLVGKPVPPPILTAPPSLPADPPDRAVPRQTAQLLETVQRSGDPPLAEAVRDKIPAPGPKLAAQLLSAMSTAAQPQGLARFLGDGLVTALTHAAPQALDGLARHWEAAAIPVQGPGDGDWRSLMIPFLMGGEVTNLRLTIRQRGKGKLAAAEREKGTRFLLDLDLSRLGPMQFDGLVKRQHKRFDLIIRTTKALPGEMRRDIDALFLGGLTNFGLEGSVSFKPEGRFVTTPHLTGRANGIIFA